MWVNVRNDPGCQSRGDRFDRRRGCVQRRPLRSVCSKENRRPMLRISRRLLPPFRLRVREHQRSLATREEVSDFMTMRKGQIQ